LPWTNSRAQKLLSEAKPDELAIALQEVPSWLEARGHDASWVPSVLAERVPDVSDKAERLRKAKQISMIGQATIEKVRSGLRSSNPPNVMLDRDVISKCDPAAGQSPQGSSQVTQEQLSRMPVDQIMTPYRDGKLNHLLGR
jgi:hypothetical protein